MWIPRRKAHLALANKIFTPSVINITWKSLRRYVHLKIYTPPVVHFSKIFHRGCMDFKWSSPICKLGVSLPLQYIYTTTGLWIPMYWPFHCPHIGDIAAEFLPSVPRRHTVMLAISLYLTTGINSQELAVSWSILYRWYRCWVLCLHLFITW